MTASVRVRCSLLVLLVVVTAGLVAACGRAGAGSEAGSPELGTFGVDLTARKDSVRPGDDFFQYANGTWMDTFEIPADRVRWGAFDILRDRTDEQVRALIDGLAAESSAPGSPEQKVGDYYASWMDTGAVDARGIAPLQPDLERIAAISSPAELPAEFGRSNLVGSASPIYQEASIDRRDPNRYTLDVGLGGLGLPDRDYYLDPSERFATIRQQYVAHIQQMLQFAPGLTAEAAASQATAILELETKIATLQWPRAELRDRVKTLNPTTVPELGPTYTGFDWTAFLEAGGMDTATTVNVSHPNVIQPLIALTRTVPLETWKAYLRYHLISGNASVLSSAIDDANFAFYGRTLAGQQQQRDRWERGVSLVGARESLGEALGQVYVDRHFPVSAKEKMVELVENLRRAYGERIRAVDWMSEATKAEALAKLAAFRPKIGYPDAWQDLSGIAIVAGDLFGNYRRVRRFFREFDGDRLTRQTDRDEWFMTPQTVNAYYNSQFNEIVFPAAILQPPFFDQWADPAVNYGAIGAVIGHEMGHGFDDQGSRSDARGVQRDWWTAEDRAAFDARTTKLAEQYSRYEAAPGVFVDGKFTLGENIGDLGGVEVAYRAYQISLNGQPAPVIDGLTGDQRFFLAFAQVWRSKIREEALVRQLTSDPHSPAVYRLNGVVRNVNAWYDAFGVTDGHAMYLPPAERVSIW
jgi:putative endopeptidase